MFVEFICTIRFLIASGFKTIFYLSKRNNLVALYIRWSISLLGDGGFCGFTQLNILCCIIITRESFLKKT